MKFSKGKHKVLPLWRNNSWHQYILVANYLQSSLVEKALGVLVDKLCQQFALTEKQANILLVCMGKTIASRLREAILPLCSALVRLYLAAGSSAGLPSTTETWTYWCELNERSQRWLRAWSIFHKRRG